MSYLDGPTYDTPFDVTFKCPCCDRIIHLSQQHLMWDIIQTQWAGEAQELFCFECLDGNCWDDDCHCSIKLEINNEVSSSFES